MADYKKLSGRSTTTEIIPGETKRWFWGSFNDITLCPRPKNLSNYTTFSSLVDILDDITFGAGKGFVEIYQTRDKGTFKLESKGERDMAGMGGTSSTMYPGSDSEALGMMRVLRSDYGVILKELANGDLFLQGSKRFPVEAKIGFDAGLNESGYLGLAITFDIFEVWVQKYKGTVTMSPEGGDYVPES